MTASEAEPVVGPTQAQLDAAAENTRDWLYATGDYSMRRYVQLDEIALGTLWGRRQEYRGEGKGGR